MPTFFSLLLGLLTGLVSGVIACKIGNYFACRTKFYLASLSWFLTGSSIIMVVGVLIDPLIKDDPFLYWFLSSVMYLFVSSILFAASPDTDKKKPVATVTKTECEDEEDDVETLEEPKST